jgi:hypothetical protein
MRPFSFRCMPRLLAIAQEPERLVFVYLGASVQTVQSEDYDAKEKKQVSLHIIYPPAMNLPCPVFGRFILSAFAQMFFSINT